jgi:arginine decarboxylase
VGRHFCEPQVGRAFHEFYGENLFRSDLSVYIEELGSLLDHSGWIGEAERNAARIFGADLSYFVLNGTSTANQIVGHSCVVSGDVVLADRNCHKSVNYSFCVTNAVPIYLHPIRNGYGIIGPAPQMSLPLLKVRFGRGVEPSPGNPVAEVPICVLKIVLHS